MMEHMAAKLIEMASNGRLVIPRELRAELGLHESEQFTAEIQNGSIILTPTAAVPLGPATWHDQR